MDQVGVEGDGAARRAAPEQVDQATRPDRGDGVRPDLGHAGRVDRDPGALAALGFGADHLGLAAAAGDLDGLGGPQLPADLEAAGLGIGQDDPVPLDRQRRDEKEPDRTGAENQNLHRLALGVARQVRGLDAVEDAPEGLGQGRLFKPQALRNPVGAALDESLGDEEELGEGAVEVVEIFAQVFTAHSAGLARQAGRRVGDHHRLAPGERLDLRPDGGDQARHLVAEQGRRPEHAGVAAAPENLDVGAASGGCFHAQQNLAGAGPGNRDLANLDSLGPQQHRPPHRLWRLHLSARLDLGWREEDLQGPVIPDQRDTALEIVERHSVADQG